MKIIKQIDDETFVISMKDVQKGVGAERIVIAHDYLRILGHTGLYLDRQELDRNFVLSGRHAFCANVISIPVDVTIGIKSAQKVLLPLLQRHKYMQPEHLVDGEHYEDDKYWNSEWNKDKFTGPRFRKGDKYPAYSYNNQIIEYWENDELMVEFSLEGEKNYSKVTAKFFNEYVKPKLIKQ